MPADVRGSVDQLVAGVDRELDFVATALTAHAVDLTNRAHVAASDSLAAALIDFGYGAPAPTSVNDALASALVAAGFGADAPTPVGPGSTPNIVINPRGGIVTLDATAPSSLWNNFSWESPFSPGGGNMADVFALLSAPVPTTRAGSINPRVLYNYKNDVMMQRAYPSGAGQPLNIVPFSSPWTNPSSVP
jgi:hypothetical protein